jgi:hypothetical protein
VTSTLIETTAPQRRQLVTFGVTMAVAIAVLALLRVWRRGFDEIAIAAFVVVALFAISTLAAPKTLAPVYRVWMRFAEVLGWINTRVLLILIFYLVVTPIGLMMRIFRRSPLDDGYWKDVPRSSFEKQF